jgi:hypothetical protein
MGELMIRCPKTGRPVTTGIHMERERFGSMPVFFCSSFCPLCGISHDWFARDAWICDSASADRDHHCEHRVA